MGVLALLWLAPADLVRAQDAEHDAPAARESVEFGEVTDEGTVEIERPNTDATPQEGLGFGGIPVVSFNSDDGVGFGGIGSLFWHDGQTLPFKYQLRLQLFFTSKGINAHELRFEGLNVFDLPLRVVVRANFYSSISQNFCGFGNAVTCSEDDADAALERQALSPVDRALAKQTYYKHRFVRPNLTARARWAFNQKPHRLELMASYRAFYYQPGQLFTNGQFLEPTAYPHSKVEEVFGPRADGSNGTTSQKGLASVFQFGVMLDNRDNEPAPKKGYWIEASTRASTFLWGSSWDYVGLNWTTRLYTPLNEEETLVLAQRYIVDATVGDMPVQEMIRVGGSIDFTAFGGLDVGRGLRIQRNIGRIKLLDTTELRWKFHGWTLFNQRFDHTLVGFVDAGLIALDWTTLLEEMPRINFGFGGGIRIAWNEAFVVRIDVGVSREEHYEPGIYVQIGHTF